MTKMTDKVEPVKSGNVKEVLADSLPTFSKEQLVQSKKYLHRRDALNALLENGKAYSFAQVDDILKNFDEGGNT